MQETRTTTRVEIPLLGAVRAGAIARREVPAGSRSGRAPGAVLLGDLHRHLQPDEVELSHRCVDMADRLASVCAAIRAAD